MSTLRDYREANALYQKKQLLFASKSRIFFSRLLRIIVVVPPCVAMFLARSLSGLKKPPIPQRREPGTTETEQSLKNLRIGEMMQPLKIFISSTYIDLMDYRQVANEVVNRYKSVPLAMEFSGAQPGDATNVSLKAI